MIPTAYHPIPPPDPDATTAVCFRLTAGRWRATDLSDTRAGDFLLTLLLPRAALGGGELQHGAELHRLSLARITQVTAGDEAGDCAGTVGTDTVCDLLTLAGERVLAIVGAS